MPDIDETDPDLRIDVRVLSFSVLIAALTGMLAGLLPALKASAPSLVSDLRGEAPAGKPRISPIRLTMDPIGQRASRPNFFCRDLWRVPARAAHAQSAPSLTTVASRAGAVRPITGIVTNCHAVNHVAHRPFLQAWITKITGGGP